MRFKFDFDTFVGILVAIFFCDVVVGFTFLTYHLVTTLR